MRVNSPRPLPLIPPLWASQRALSQANLHYDPIVHYSILYNRSLPYWSGILWLIIFRPLLAEKCEKCLRVDLTLGFIFVSLGFFWGSLLYGWVKGGWWGGGGEGWKGRRNPGFRALLPSAGRYSRHAVVRHIFGSLPNRPCLEEVNNSRPKGCFEHTIDWQFFSIPRTRCIFPQKFISRSSCALTLWSRDMWRDQKY